MVYRSSVFVAAGVLVFASACNRTPAPASSSDTSHEAYREAAKPTAPAAPTGPTRTENDLLGEKEVPADAYYGVQTARALENFQISGITINHYPGFVEAWAIVKLAAARANTEVGAMKQETARGDREGRARRVHARQVPRSVPASTGTRAAPAPRRT